MKKYLPLLILICFALPVSLAAQTLWPFNIPNLPTSCNPTMNNTSTCTRTAVTNNGDWSTASTWSPVGVPTVDDIVCIPRGITVRVNNPTYTPISTPCGNTFTNTIASPRLAIFLCGTIDFKAGGKLNLGCGSKISVLASSGTILSANGNSDQIQIGNRVVWGGNNTDINAPAFINSGGVYNGVLSVNLEEFSAVLKSSNEVLLKWSTTLEINSKSFIVEKSINRTDWIIVEAIKALGNSDTKIDYSYVDRRPLSNMSYYRLRHVNMDGNSVYSETVTILNKTKNKIAVYPNPAVSNASLYTSDVLGRNQTVQLYNINGAFIQNLNPTTSNVLHFSTSHLSPGLYLIRIVENGKTIAETKLIKQ